MKILFIPDNFPPEVNALASRTYEHGEQWVRRGAEVRIVTCVPNFPQGRIYPGYKNKLWQRETMAGMKVLRVWSYVAPNAGIARRVIDQLSFAVTGFLAGLFQPADVIIASTPHFFPIFTACALSIVRRKPWIFEVRDLWTDSIMAVGVMKQNLLIRILQALERFLYRHADRIVIVSPAFKPVLLRDHVPAQKIEIVTNGVNRAQFPPMARDATLARALGLEGKFVFGYVGTHGMAHALDFVLRAAAKVANPAVHFLFVGDGAEKANLLKLAAELDLKNVTFLPPVPKDRVPEMLAQTDIALVPLRKTETFLTVIPSKIFESASMHKPSLLGVDGQAREIVEHYDAGLYFEPENEAAFLAAINRLTDDAGLRARLQAGCENLANDYGRIALADRMLAILEDVVEKRKKR